jgi:hypothetical protein
LNKEEELNQLSTEEQVQQQQQEEESQSSEEKEVQDQTVQTDKIELYRDLARLRLEKEAEFHWLLRTGTYLWIINQTKFSSKYSKSSNLYINQYINQCNNQCNS